MSWVARFALKAFRHRIFSEKPQACSGASWTTSLLDGCNLRIADRAGIALDNLVVDEVPTATSGLLCGGMFAVVVRLAGISRVCFESDYLPRQVKVARTAAAGRTFSKLPTAEEAYSLPKIDGVC